MKIRPATMLILAVLGFVLWGYVVGPMAATLLETVKDGPGGPFGDWRRFFNFANPAELEAMWGSLWISLLSVITSGVVGVGLAVLFHRWDFPLKKLCGVAVLAPFALPPLIGAEAFVLLFGIGGTIPRLMEGLFRIEPNTIYVDGFWGVLLVHTLTMYPYFYLVAAAALAQSDDSLEEAAYSLGASRLQTWSRVLLPMLTPAIVSGGLLTFMSSMASYTAPYVFHYDQMMTVHIANAKTSFQMRMASVISVVLAGISILFLVIIRHYERNKIYRTQSKGGARIRRRVTGGVARAVALVLALASVLFLLLPIAMIFVLAFSVNGSWTTTALPTRYSVDNFVRLFTDSATWAPVKNSLEMSAIAVVGTIVLGVACAYIITRMRVRGRGLIDSAVMLPWALPGTVVAINLIAAFARPSFFSFGRALIATYAIVPLAYFVRFTPLVFRSTAASLEQIDPSLEEAARSLGSSWWQAFSRVVLPLLYRGIAAGALLAFVAGVGEFVATTLLQSPFYPTISIAIQNALYTQASASSGIGTAAAFGVIQILIVVIAVMISNLIGRARTPVL
jgi:iron(III) transport system permease protein